MSRARVVEAALRRGSDSLSELLAFLGSDVESAVLFIDDGQWISSRKAADPTHLPAPLLTMAQQGQAAAQRVMSGGVPVLAVGLPMPAISATYVEVFPLRELDRNLRFSAGCSLPVPPPAAWPRHCSAVGPPLALFARSPN